MSMFSGSDIFEEKKNWGVGISEAVEISSAPKKRAAAEAASEVAKKRLSGISTSSNEPIKAIIVYPKGHSNKPCKDVTKDFIKDFNKHRGNQDNVELARKMLAKTRQLAGLDPGSSYIDIPSARHNLFLLAGLNNQELKMAALSSLNQVLEADQVQRDSAFEIVVLAIDLMKEMDRELMQTQLIDEQICICTAYGLIAELIQRHYAKKHLGGITSELKDQLIQTAKTLEDLNTHYDAHLHYSVEYALEGIKRLRDDRKELFEMFERMFHLVTAAVAFHENIPDAFKDNIVEAFKGLDIRMTHAWFDVTLLLNAIAKRAHHDNNKLMLLQYMIKEHAKPLDWKFSYNAIEKLGEIALNGSTPDIRMAALMGQKYVKEQHPGIIDFVDFKVYSPKTSMKPMIHFKRPVSKDNNIQVRQHCIETLIQIAREGQDAALRRKAKEGLYQRYKEEDDQGILKIIANAIPKKKSEKTFWLNEQGAYAYKPASDVKTVEEDHSNDIQTIAHQLLHSKPEAAAPDTFSTTIPPSQVSLLLGNCLGLDPYLIQLHIHPGKDIQVNAHQQLHINLEGMKQIKEFLDKGKSTVKAINFSYSQIDDQALEFLSESISTWNIFLLRLPSIPTSAALRFANALIENGNLKIILDSPEQDLLLGQALMEAKNALIALEFFITAYKKIGDDEDQKNLKATALYQIGRASLSLGHLENGEAALLKSLKIQPNNYKTNLLLANFYKDQNKVIEANRYAEKAKRI